MNQSKATSTAVIPFSYESKAVRVTQDDFGNPWWVAKDVCNILALKNIAMATSKIPDKHLKSIRLMSGGQNREMVAVDEPGLYRLILRCDKPQAEPFMEWVTSEVIPQIRKTGSYSVPNTYPPEGYRKRPELPDGMKRCSTCHKLLPATTGFFYRNVSKIDGMTTECIPCRKDYRYKYDGTPKLIAHKASVLDFNMLADRVAKLEAAVSRI